MNVLNLVTTPDKTFFRRQVAALEAEGIDVTVLPVPGRNTAQSTAADGSDTRSVSDYLRFYPRVLRQSFGDYDVLHASYGLTAPAAIAQPNLPVVCSLWGSDLMGRYGPLVKWCCRWCDAVIVMSDGMATELGRDCHVIPHGIDLERFAPQPHLDARRALGWDTDAAHVLFPYPRKRLVKDYPRAERVVDAARDRVDGTVHLHTASNIPHDRMPTHMNAADVLLLTSKREGMPNTVKEALACNLPVVSTDVGDVSEWLDAVTPSTTARTDGELVDALVDLLDCPRRSDGRTVVCEISWDRTAARITDVYRSVQ